MTFANPNLVPGKSQTALTRLEVAVLVAALAVLVCFLLSLETQWRRKAQRISCVGNLKNIGMSFRVWAGDHSGLFPMGVSTNLGGTQDYVEWSELFRHFQAISNELVSPRLLVCPTDTRRSAHSWDDLSNTNISYFVGIDADETRPSTWLAGDRNLEIDGVPAKPGLHILWSNHVVGWTGELHNRVGNIGFADGSVQQLPRGRMNLAGSGITNRIAIP